MDLSTAKGMHKHLNDLIERNFNGELDNDRANTQSRLIGNKLSLISNEIRHKKLTAKPEQIKFFTRDPH